MFPFLLALLFILKHSPRLLNIAAHQSNIFKKNSSSRNAMSIVLAVLLNIAEGKKFFRTYEADANCFGETFY